MPSWFWTKPSESASFGNVTVNSVLFTSCPRNRSQIAWIALMSPVQIRFEVESQRHFRYSSHSQAHVAAGWQIDLFWLRHRRKPNEERRRWTHQTGASCLCQSTIPRASGSASEWEIFLSRQTMSVPAPIALTFFPAICFLFNRNTKIKTEFQKKFIKYVRIGAIIFYGVLHSPLLSAQGCPIPASQARMLDESSLNTRNPISP